MISRLTHLLLRLTLPDGPIGQEIRIDLIRESEDLASRHSSRRVDLWRLLEAIKLALHFSLRRLRPSTDPSRSNRPGPDGFRGISDDIRYAFRRLKRAPLATGVAVAVAGIAIGSVTATYSVLDAVLLRPLPYPEADRLVQIWETSPERFETGAETWSDRGVNALNFLEYEAQAGSFSEMAWTVQYAANGRATIGRGEGATQLVEAMGVSPSFFSVLGTTLPLGRSFLPEETAPAGENRWTPVAIISDRLWRGRYASDPNILGREILLDGGTSTVVGVLPAEFRFPPMSERGEVRERDVDVLLPLFYPAFSQNRANRQFRVLARLRPGVDLQDAQAEMSRISTRLETDYPESQAGWVSVVTPLHDLLVRDYGLAFFSLMGMVALVLLVACGNLASLALAQGTGRRPELALRAAIGGGRARLFRLLIAESLLLASLGGALGIFLARWGTAGLVALVPAGLTRAADAGLDGRVLAFAVTLSAATGLIFGVVPAYRSSKVDLTHDLRGAGQGGRQLGWSPLSKSLITGQVALTLVLLMGGGLLGKSFLQLRTQDRGYVADNVLTVTIRTGAHHPLRPDRGYDLEGRRARWNSSYEIMERVRALPGVQSVAAGELRVNDLDSWSIQFRTHAPTELDRFGNPPPDESVSSFVTNVSPEYFETLGIPLVRGVGLPTWTAGSDADRYSSWATDGPDCRLAAKAADRPGLADELERCSGPQVLVSETFAATAWPGEDPIGKEVGIYGCCWTVAGVVADVSARGVDAQALSGRIARSPAMMLYVPYSGIGPYVIKTRLDPLDLVAPVRAIIASVDQESAVTFSTLEQQVADSLARPRFYSVAAALFGCVALAMALVGLYGLLAQAVGRRVHEMGVRMALGASRNELREMVVGQGMRPVLVGVVLGLLASVAAARLLESLLYGMGALDPWLAVGVSLAMMVAAAAACYLPANRASQVDPIRSLAHE